MSTSGGAVRHAPIIPTEHQLAILAQTRVAVTEGALALLEAIEPVPVSAITDDQIECSLRKELVEPLEGRDHMVTTAESARQRVPAHGPVLLVREERPLVMAGVPLRANEQNRLQVRARGVVRQNELLEHAPLGQWSGKAALREAAFHLRAHEHDRDLRR